ncbi:MAG: CvpA family protein [Christensenellales bacterium]
MNIVDLVIISVVVLSIIFSARKGFLVSVLSIGSFIVSWLMAYIFYPLVSRAFMTGDFFQTILNYTDGAQLVSNFQTAHAPIQNFSSGEIAQIVQKSNLPVPVNSIVQSNIAGEVFAKQGLTTVGDYFSQTIGIVVMNIFSFLLIYVVIQIILLIVLNCVNFVRRMPVLKQADGFLGGCFGAARGIMLVFVLFMLVPVILIIVPYNASYELIEKSLFGNFFYKSNFLLSLITGVL